MTNYCYVIDYLGDLFISGDFDRVVYCSQVEYLTIIVICFFYGDLSVASVTLIGIRYTETVSELQQQQIIDSSCTLQSFSRRLAYSPVSHFT